MRRFLYAVARAAAKFSVTGPSPRLRVATSRSVALFFARCVAAKNLISGAAGDSYEQRMLTQFGILKQMLVGKASGEDAVNAFERPEAKAIAKIIERGFGGAQEDQLLAATVILYEKDMVSARRPSFSASRSGKP